MLLRGMGREALRYHEVFGETRSTVYGKPITGLEGKGEGEVKQKTGKRGGIFPLKSLKLHDARQYRRVHEINTS